MRFEFPESLRAYYANPSIEAAVDALLTRPGKMPSDLSWEELGGYYAAWAAAHRVQGDYGVATAQLWDFFWRDALASAGWQPLSVDDQIEEDKQNDPHPTQVWAWECITRTHERGSDTIYTCVGLNKGSVDLGIGLFGRTGRNLWTTPIPGFERDPEYDVHWTISRAKIEKDGAADLSELLKHRDAAIAALTARDV